MRPKGAPDRRGRGDSPPPADLEAEGDADEQRVRVDRRAHVGTDVALSEREFGAEVRDRGVAVALVPWREVSIVRVRHEDGPPRRPPVNDLLNETSKAETMPAGNSVSTSRFSVNAPHR
jgi:hypothetical protein